MKLLLMQHGDALSKKENAERPLSAKGEDDVRRVAGFLKNTDVSVESIVHSGKRRAEQTALIMSSLLNASADISISEQINPNDDVGVFYNQLTKNNKTTLIVGHLPFMAKFVSLLCVNNVNASPVSYEPGSVVCMENNTQDGWRINWMVRPELI